MASKRHDFIVAAIARKLRKDGFRIIYLDGKYQDISAERPDLPPKIINHRPDIVGDKNSLIFCIGEAKTKNDLHSDRTKKQLIDFLAVTELAPRKQANHRYSYDRQGRFKNIITETWTHKQKAIGNNLYT